MHRSIDDHSLKSSDDYQESPHDKLSGGALLENKILSKPENLLETEFNFDALSTSNDELFKTKDFRNRLKDLGPDIFKNSKMAAKVEPFKLERVYAVNKKSRVVNLSTTKEKLVLFPVSQNAVLFNKTKDEMFFLQGHQHNIASLSSSLNGKWLVTADCGSDNIVIVWERDNNTASPVLIIFDPYKSKRLLYAAISTSGKFLLTIGEGETEDTVSFKMWSWTKAEEEPQDAVQLKNTFGDIVCIETIPQLDEFFMVIFKKAVVFLTWNTTNLKFEEPYVPSIKHKSKIGSFTDGTYIDNCHECMVSSDEGYVTFFGNSLFLKQLNEAAPDNKKIFVKTAKVSHGSVNTIASADTIVITGDSLGNINLFDKRLRLIYWMDSFVGSPIQSISFNTIAKNVLISRICINDQIDFMANDSDTDSNSLVDKTQELEIIYRDQLKEDVSPIREKWVVRDFTVSHDGQITFVEFIVDCNTELLFVADDYIAAIDTHADFAFLVVGYCNGTICLYDYEKNEAIVKYKLPKPSDLREEYDPSMITSMKYSPLSLHLACGRSNGELWILDPVLLRPKQKAPFRLSEFPILQIEFSPDNLQMAYYTSNCTVYFFCFHGEEGEGLWSSSGKVRSHYKSICDMFFYPNDPATLVTVGQDRTYVEYNNVDFQFGHEFAILTKVRIEQQSIPLCCMPYPKLDPRIEHRYFVTSDNMHKYKLVNEQTKMQRSVLLGPAYGCYQNTPVVKMQLLNGGEDQYMVFMTKNHFGLQKLPLDGNPYSFVGCLGHANKLKDFAVSADGRYVFTFGLQDNTFYKWRTCTKGVDLMHKLGGDDFEPLYCVIEGGKGGFLFQEMQDLFFYMQILHQGENSALPRRVSDKISVNELPDLVRACGYYPTDYEIETFLVDIKYRNFDLDGSLKEDISFLEFVKLYVNHKPAYGYSIEALQNSFQNMTESVEDPEPGLLKREDFLDTVTRIGEPFSVPEISRCMEILMGASGVDESGTYNFDFIPENMNFDTFRDNILGIDMDRMSFEFEKETEEEEEEESIDEEDECLSKITATSEYSVIYTTDPY